MKSIPKTGMAGEQKFTVELKHAIDFADNGMPAVLSTPSLLWFLEHAARAAVLPVLEAGESTVGTEIDLRHLAPTPVGETVTCQARILQVEGSRISFQLEASDEHKLIARGFHRLQIIQVARFAKLLQGRLNPASGTELRQTPYSR
jgi:fluoroacetyl-CoA thioesterase